MRARRGGKAATSDWMAIEKERGISISSTALSFGYKGFLLNLLDTPGHADFSEDTYRTVTAADNAVMLIDSAKGLEPQTRKVGPYTSPLFSSLSRSVTVLSPKPPRLIH